jgi:hypothetical protein
MTETSTRRAPRPSAAEFLHQLRTVAADLPLFLTAPLYRRWHLRWGATPAELAATLPGDERLPRAQFRCTRAITIDAPPEAVWPWLVQVGCRRGGFYSNDLLDNLARPSAREVMPELQHLEVGQLVPMSAKAPSDVTAFKVDSFEVNRWLLWRKPDSTWAWTLTGLGDGTTRLLTRVHAAYEWRDPALALSGIVLMEFGDFAMMRRMLYGIRERAEKLHRGGTLGAQWSGARHRPRPGDQSGQASGDHHAREAFAAATPTNRLRPSGRSRSGPAVRP